MDYFEFGLRNKFPFPSHGPTPPSTGRTHRGKLPASTFSNRVVVERLHLGTAPAPGKQDAAPRKRSPRKLKKIDAVRLAQPGRSIDAGASINDTISAVLKQETARMEQKERRKRRASHAPADIGYLRPDGMPVEGDANKHEHRFLETMLQTMETQHNSYQQDLQTHESRQLLQQLFGGDAVSFQKRACEDTKLPLATENVIESRKNTTALADLLKNTLKQSKETLTKAVEVARLGAVVPHPPRPETATNVHSLSVASTFFNEISIWEIVLGELNKQVRRRCKERGELLSKARSRIFFILDFLTKVMHAQQLMIEALGERCQFMRPRTRTVEAKFRRDRRKTLGKIAAAQYSRHEVEMGQLHDRLNELGETLQPMTKTHVALDKSEYEYEQARAHFKSLLRSIHAIESETDRVKYLMKAENEAGDRAREVVEAHRQCIEQKEREKQEALLAATKLQKVWRGMQSRRYAIPMARIEYQRRQLVALRLREKREKEEREHLERISATKIQRFWKHVRMKHHWNMSVGELKQQAARLAEAKRREEKSKIRGWRSYVKAANKIAAAYRKHLFNKLYWRRRVLEKHKQDMTTQLLDSIAGVDAPAIKRRINQVISVNLQRQEHDYLDMVHALQLRITHLESKCHAIDERSKREAREYAGKKESLDSLLLARTKTLEQRYKEAARRQNLEYHAACHELERIKQQGVKKAEGAIAHQKTVWERRKVAPRRRNAISSRNSE